LAFEWKQLLGAANLLSLIRIPLAVVMVFVYEQKTLFLGLLVLAIVTDALDGYVARKTGATALGAFLDPLCDKIFIVILLLFVLFSGRIGVLLFVLLILRDIYMVLMYAVFWRHPKRGMLKKHIKARWSGKVVTVGQFVALVWLFFGIDYFSYVVFAVAVVSLYAVLDYSMFVKKLLR
jgi:cardiolipin synthase